MGHGGKGRYGGNGGYGSGYNNGGNVYQNYNNGYQNHGGNGGDNGYGQDNRSQSQPWNFRQNYSGQPKNGGNKVANLANIAMGSLGNVMQERFDEIEQAQPFAIEQAVFTGKPIPANLATSGGGGVLGFESLLGIATAPSGGTLNTAGTGLEALFKPAVTAGRQQESLTAAHLIQRAAGAAETSTSSSTSSSAQPIDSQVAFDRYMENSLRHKKTQQHLTNLEDGHRIMKSDISALAKGQQTMTDPLTRIERAVQPPQLHKGPQARSARPQPDERETRDTTRKRDRSCGSDAPSAPGYGYMSHFGVSPGKHAKGIGEIRLTSTEVHTRSNRACTATTPEAMATI